MYWFDFGYFNETAMKREEGFYWVNQKGLWLIAEWTYRHNSSGEWYFVGCEYPFREHELIEIDERRIERQP